MATIVKGSVKRDRANRLSCSCVLADGTRAHFTDNGQEVRSAEMFQPWVDRCEVYYLAGELGAAAKRLREDGTCE